MGQTDRGPEFPKCSVSKVTVSIYFQLDAILPAYRQSMYPISIEVSNAA